ncbi:Ras family protein [Trichomonas vaginalis G3]|uniref:Ras family protein n=1 Tax=Trichomonas vaginalis (strain ATCC PRA-98 / G3) TaxID=412133 RepID=A2EM21_TRIV3|nr:GTPase protein [Trichomonas vaginalis G3]EAY06280.1 Ras family protein [Trichomonas vaginalis G3]KAI5503358.1 GTPase protein [Trichomonas vaginalis G3]|eukprot:XP_001318503.1 Ras family protein [Trichomonas vaginalis G3]
MGSGGVGKSALTIRLVQDRFSTVYDPTIEDSYVKLLNVDGKPLKLDILDTAGQDDFKAIRETYMRSGNGFLVVFSLIDSHSFDMVNGYIKDIRLTNGREDIPIVCCGNKCDLGDQRQISPEEVEEYFRSVKCCYFETSAARNINVQEAFLTVARMMREANPNYYSPSDIPGKKDSRSNVDQSEEPDCACNIL